MASGRATVTDFMPAPPLARDGQTPMETVFRRLRCDRWQVKLRVDFAPRFEYAQTNSRDVADYPHEINYDREVRLFESICQ